MPCPSASAPDHDRSDRNSAKAGQAPDTPDPPAVSTATGNGHIGARPQRESFSARLERSGRALSPAGQRVAGFIASNPAAALASSALELAARTGTSDATVIRSVQALGYTGLPELKQVLIEELDRRLTPADDMRQTLSELGTGTVRALDAVLDAHEDAVRALRSPEFREQLGAAVSFLQTAERVVTFGIGPSAVLARYLALMLARVGRRSHCLDTAGLMLADQMLDLRPGDVILALAYGRAYREVTGLFAEARRVGVRIVLVSDTVGNPVEQAADLVLVIPRGRREHVALHGGTLVGLEALALALAASDRDRALATLERLNALRAAVSGQGFEVG